MIKARAILFNGPPGCGKDTIVNHLSQVLPAVEARKFATHVKEATHAIFGLFDTLGRPVAHDAFEDCKNEPRDEFNGMSPRQAYIWFSEEVMKPKFGKGVFGQIEARKLNCEAPDLYAFSDSGFAEEAREVVKVLGPDRVFLVNIFRDGHTFEGDSRGYIHAEDIGIPPQNQWQINNYLGLAELHAVAEEIAVEVLARTG